jgi:hypothetical protein
MGSAIAKRLKGKPGALARAGAAPKKAARGVAKKTARAGAEKTAKPAKKAAKPVAAKAVKKVVKKSTKKPVKTVGRPSAGRRTVRRSAARSTPRRPK